MNYWDDLLMEDRIVPQQMSVAPKICIKVREALRGKFHHLLAYNVDSNPGTVQ